MSDIELVNNDAYALRYVQNQTHEICMAAVQQDGSLLQWVENQSLEICMAAVQQYGLALQYVHNQTPEICMAAVQKDGNALQCVENQTLEICMAAVHENESALYFVHNQIPEICMAAVQKRGILCIYIKSELFDHDEYVHLMYLALYKSHIFSDGIHCDTIENRINCLQEHCERVTDELIDEIIAINSRSTKRAI
jgi:hypothetical protein